MRLQELHEAMDDLHALHEFPGGWIHADGKVVFNKYEEGEDPHQVEDHSYNAYIHFQDKIDWSEAEDMVEATHDVAWEHGWIKVAVSPILLYAAWDKQVTPQAIEGLKQLMDRAEKVRPNLKYEFTPHANEMHEQVPTFTREQALEFLANQAVAG
jgi:hypothetical protein